MSAATHEAPGATADTPASAAVDRVRQRVAAERGATRRTEALVLAIADAIKATSNDQNVQRLSRELRAAAGELAADAAGR